MAAQSIGPAGSALSEPFAAFRGALREQPALRAAITAAYRRPEAACVAPLLDLAAMPDEAAGRAAATARSLIERLRAKVRSGGIDALILEYSLSSHEGVALMCLAEALLRIPDAATRDALIKDKIAHGDWRAHAGHSPSMFVNAATWGLVVTGRLTATTAETSLSAALTRLIGRGGEPLIRKGTDLAMRMLGDQFVTGRTIAEALVRSRRMEARGFRYSYDMLGEAAMTARDAAHYLKDYETAIAAIGAASAGRGIYEGPGISIKLSALHPRYARSKIERVTAELLPHVKRLALLAKGFDIGLNIDAEEADRLELSLDLFEALALDPDLKNWDGLGFVVQAYGKRCPFVIDWLVDLARRAGRRIMVRLVKGAYWDSEIKRAQVDGLEDFPVFTRKAHTDVSYTACVRKLLAAPDAVFPQFATHNARTLAGILELAGPNFHRGRYEFQCLHGMGEPLYEEVVGPDRLDRPCRIYAPVGSHETLLAYLVRRLLENGANSSFVNRVADPAVPIDALAADPVASVRASSPIGAPHRRIAHPHALFPDRVNAAGLDLSDEPTLARLAGALVEGARIPWRAVPSGASGEGTFRPVLNPADHRDVVGHVRDATPGEIEAALSTAPEAAHRWASVSVGERAACLVRAADAVETRLPVLIGLLVREAGKTCASAVAEVREAVDFLRYYAGEALRIAGTGAHAPLGPVVCISPWNFPLAIFTGQVAAALAAGNAVLAKPAEETPLIAAEAVRILHEAGIPTGVLQFVPGAGEAGAAMVGDSRVHGVMFTGSAVVARSIHGQLAERLMPGDGPILLIAETGGLNVLIADSSALAEQVVADAVASAFDSAGQRCSALRILCLQEEVADGIFAMLDGTVRELEIGNPERLSIDVGPVITAEARDDIRRHIETMRARGHRIRELALPAGTRHGSFVAPTLIEIDRIADVEREVFGPVLHVLRYRREDLDRLVTEINDTGYGLTFGLHTRLDETIARVVDRIEAGNVYVNRNIIGAVVGVQPFGGSGLSGTGPKAGGPLYLRRLIETSPRLASDAFEGVESAPARAYAEWLQAQGHTFEAGRAESYISRSAVGSRIELPGPVGERNVYTLRPRGRVAALARTGSGLLVQVGVILATGNTAVIERRNPARPALDGLPAAAGSRVVTVDDWQAEAGLRAVLFEGERDDLIVLNRAIARRQGAILPVQAMTPARSAQAADYDPAGLVEERSISTNTAAAGGDASLISIG